MSSYLNTNELTDLKLNHLGSNVRISNRASLYNTANISIEDNVRIDDGCVIAIGDKGSLHIHNHVHLGSHCYISGSGDVSIGACTAFAPFVAVFSTSDYYDLRSLVGGAVDPHYVDADTQSISIGKCNLIGCRATLLPGCQLSDSCSVGAHSVVKHSFEQGLVIAGIPAKIIGKTTSKCMQIGEKLGLL